VSAQTPDAAGHPLLAAKGICKAYGGVKALRNAVLTARRGEVLAVVGENGAGKSTLMKILAGVTTPDEGEIFLDGQPVRFDSPREAQNHGIALIHQELNLCDNLDVGANILLGHETSRFGFNQSGKRLPEIEQLVKKVGLDIPVRTVVSQLAVGQQQLVEIAKALSVRARILIMDEPTSSLSGREAEKLFQVIRELKAEGTCIIYISHRLREIETIADRVVVLRDGENVGELDRSSITHERIVELMVGREISRIFSRTTHSPGPVSLEVEDFETARWPGRKNCFRVHAGEVVGIAGLVGAGRTELFNALFGIDPPLGGKLMVHGATKRIHSPREAIRFGIAYVPEDRKQHGLLLDWSLARNNSLPQLGEKRFSTMGLIRKKQEALVSTARIGQLRIRASGQDQAAGALSGGNQQKVVIGKWLGTDPKVLLLDEPTRGVDVGAKQEIYRLMDELAGKGMAILFVSSELEEVMGLSDRVLVMRDGLITGELSRGSLGEEAIMRLATTGGASPIQGQEKKR
jgi:ribose transport system ATP-binding protein